HELADHFGVTKRLIDSIEYLKEIGGSSLTDDRIEVAAADLGSREIPTSYVPFRNSHLLSIATSWAEVIGARRIYIGAVAEDSSGYPDCRPEFYEAFQRTIDAGTKPETRIDIVTPVISLRKSEIVKRGVELRAPLELTWSCYQAEDRVCGSRRRGSNSVCLTVMGAVITLKPVSGYNLPLPHRILSLARREPHLEV